MLCISKNFEKIKRLRNSLYLFLTVRVYFPFCMWCYSGKGKAISLEEMHKSPPGSLSFCTAIFLQKTGLRPIHGYEEHDMKHTLLGYEASLKDEVCMQYFEFANGNRSIPVMIVILFGTLIMPEEISAYLQAWKRGRKAVSISAIHLKDFAREPLYQLRSQWKL